MVSVIVPVYNSEKYLEETIVSIINQSYSYFEIILIDDGSVDSSGTICDEFAQKDNRIRVIHIQNSGPSVARNVGIKISGGDYILPVDGDDIIEPTYVEKAAKVLEENDEVGIVYCKAELIGDMSGEWLIPKYTLPEILVKNCIFATAMFRKSDWSIVGGYSETMKHGLEDYDLWLSLISLKRKVFQIPEVLFKYRKHLDSRSTKFENDSLLVSCTENIRFKRHRELFEEVYYIPEINQKIALYGAGGAGETYFGFLKSIGRDCFTCCVDKNFANIKTKVFPFGIGSPQRLFLEPFDQIVVAINNEGVYQDIKQWLLSGGYKDKQIVRYYNEDRMNAYM